jgi:RNA polymerase sigma-70 factor (ECF subfamily)
MGSRNYSERSLTEGAKTGNAKSFDRLFVVHQKYLFNLLYQLCSDIARSDDLTLETMIQAYKKIRYFRCESSFRTWLSRIAINLFRKEAKKCPKSEHLPFDGIQILDKGDHVERIVMRGQLQR